MIEHRCETCVYANWHGNYDKDKPIVCTNEKSEHLLDFVNKNDFCKFHTEEVKDFQEVASKFRCRLLYDDELYNAFVASIASALKEIPAGTGLYDVAQMVADRIIGGEK